MLIKVYTYDGVVKVRRDMAEWWAEFVEFDSENDVWISNLGVDRLLKIAGSVLITRY